MDQLAGTRRCTEILTALLTWSDTPPRRWHREQIDPVLQIRGPDSRAYIFTAHCANA